MVYYNIPIIFWWNVTQNISNPQHLYHAIAQNNVDEVKKLIPFFNLQSNNSPLMTAAQGGHVECLKLLIPVSDCTAHENVALCLAAKNGHTECVKLLLPVSTPILSNSIGALRLAAEHGHAQCVQLLVSNCTDTNATALLSASLHGHWECVKILLPFADPETLGPSLEAAARGGHAECVKLLLPVAGTNNGALKQALINGRSECAEILYPHCNIAHTLWEIDQFYAKASSMVSRQWVDEWMARKQHDALTSEINENGGVGTASVRIKKM